ncbi:MAG TPA: class D sortase [Candidatus Angelobacter sp.]|nr:class D sortase [Candidatus Angelobacter sp.]
MTKPWPFRPKPARSLGRWIPYFFFILGTLLLGYVAVTLVDAKLYQAREARVFEQARQVQREQQARNSARPFSRSESPAPLLPVRLSQPDRAATAGSEGVRGSPAWGRIEIRSIGLSSMVLEGVDSKTLRRGVGHIPGTALPGQPGNIALAGHRDTFFRALRNINKNDEITLETLDGSFRYRVDLIQVVGPEYTQVLNGSNGEILTLVTCFPFSYVGPAPQRYIVRASRIPE